MASRSAIALLVVALVAAGPLAGCLDKLFDQGDIKVVLKVSSEPSVEVNGKNYLNANQDFSEAPLIVSRVNIWPKAEASGDTVNAVVHDMQTVVDLSQGEDRTVDLVEDKLPAGVIDRVGVLTLPFNATLLNGTVVTIDVIQNPLWQYIFEVPADLEAGSMLTYQVSFMIARQAGETEGVPEYFLMMLPDEAGAR